MDSNHRDDDGAPVPAEESRALVEAAKSSGSKLGGGGANIAKDTLFTNATIKLVDLLGEGEINGIVGGLKGIYLNNTPIQNADGSMNFAGISVESRAGTPNQTYMEGYPDVQTPQDVGVQVKKAVPVTATITEPNADRARITLQIPSLLAADSKGNVKAWRVDFLIQARYSGGPWVNQLGNLAIEGKASSPFYPQYEINLPRNPSGASAPWQIQVVRLSDDATTSNQQFPEMNFASDLIYQSLTTIVDAKFSYPSSALIGITADASQFGSSLPQRQYLVDGIKMRVPVNYDPVARTYTGIWDGTFKEAWCNNPAWVLYMLLENDRFGLGQLIDVSAIDKWSLYQIGAYCDGLVPDGKGGQEPRFTFNGVISEEQDAFELLELIAQVFRGMTYWSSGTVTATQDRPADVRLLVTEANVIDGEFSYASSGRQARHTVAIVAWNDPSDFYRTNYEVVEDSAGVARYGYNPTKIDLLGCTSRGQAHRAGLWTLLTELKETQVLTYRAGLDHAVVRPGDLIAVQDPQMAAVDLSGRLLAGSTTTQLKLDRPVTFASGMTVSVIMPDGSVAERAVSGISGTTATVAALPQTPDPAAVWVIASSVKPQLFRVVSIREEEPHIYAVQALEHEPGKYATVDQGAPFEELPVSNFPNVVLPPTNLSVVESVYWERGMARQGLTLSWTAGQPFNSIGYYVTAIAPDGAIINLPRRASASADFSDVASGSWTFIVTAIGLNGQISAPAQITHTVVGWDGAAVATVTGLQVKGGGNKFSGRACQMEWSYSFPAGLAPYPVKPVVYVYDASSGALVHREMLATGQQTWVYAYDVNVAEGGPRRQFRVAVAATNPLDQEGNQTSLLVSNPVPEMIVPTVAATSTLIFVSYPTPQDLDWDGTYLWVSKEQNFDPLTTEPHDIGARLNAEVMEKPGTYYIRLAAYDAFGKNRAELNICPPLTVVVSSYLFDPSDPGIPQNLSLSTGTDVAPDGTVTAWVKATVDALGAANLGLYEFEFAEGTGAFVGGYLSSTPDVTVRPLLPGTSIRARVRSVSQNAYAKSGYSAEASILAALNTTPPANGSGLTATGGFERAYLTWTRSPTKDLRHTEVWGFDGTSAATVPPNGSTMRGTVAADATTFTDVLSTTGTRTYWLRSVSTSDVAASSYLGPVTATSAAISASQIGNGIIDATKLASGLEIPSVVTSLPAASGYTGPRLVLNTTDGKLYRYVSGAFTREVDGADLKANSVLAGTIAAGAIGTQQLAANSIVASKLAVASANLAFNGDGSQGTRGFVFDSQTAAIGLGVPTVTNDTAGPPGVVGFRLTAAGTATGAGQITARQRRMLANGTLADYAVKGGDWYEFSAYLTGSGINNARVLVNWYNGNTFLSQSAGSSVTSYPAAGSSLSAYGRSVVIAQAPATATFALVYIRFDHASGAANPWGAMFLPMFATAVANQSEASPYVDPTITAIDGANLYTGTVHGNKLIANTITANEIVVGGMDGDVVIANNTIKVGKLATDVLTASNITVSGTTKLSNWQKAGDATKIDGGQLSANTVTTNKLQVGARGLTVTGLEFQLERTGTPPTLNGWVAWSAGTIALVDDNGVTQTFNIAAGRGQMNGVRSYIWWNRAAGNTGVLQFLNESNPKENTPGAPNGVAAFVNSNPDNVLIATVSGMTGVLAFYGSTIIDGTKVTAASIGADQLAANSVQAVHIQSISATIVNAAVTSLSASVINATGTITAPIVAIGNNRFYLENATGKNGRMIINNNENTKTVLVVGDISSWTNVPGDMGIRVMQPDGSVAFQVSSTGSALNNVGTIGGNLAPNSDYSMNTTAHWGPLYTNTGKNPDCPLNAYDRSVQYANVGDIRMEMPAGVNMHSGNVWDWVNGGPLGRHPVTPGQRYEISAYVGTLACAVDCHVFWFDAGSNIISESVGAGAVKADGTAILGSVDDMNFGTTYYLGQYARIGGFVTAPAGATQALVGYRCYGRYGNAAHCFHTRFYWGLASAGQTQLTEWSPAVHLPQITSGNIGTYMATAAIASAYIGSLEASKVSVGAGGLSAISANLGTVTAGLLQSPNGKVQLNLNSGQFLVYD